MSSDGCGGPPLSGAPRPSALTDALTGAGVPILRYRARGDGPDRTASRASVGAATYSRCVALALYRKYRPATFSEVVGQEHVTDPLRKALAAGRINHAYLFSGPRGCGKTSSARILARSLNCVEGPTPDPCGVCPSCIALAPEGPGSLDVVELDAASHGGVDDTRELRDRAFYMPAESRFRVFIIDEAHMVTTQGFNALLKIVEEPPEHLVFIFATTEPDKVLTTIRSRTHHYPFRLIPPAVLRSLLERLCAEEGVTVEPTVFPLVIQAGGGSARDSLSVLDQLLAGAGDEGVTYQHAVALLGVTDAALLDEMVEALAVGDGASVFGAIDKVVEAGHDPRRFGADLLQRLRDLVILAAVPEAAAKNLIDVPADELTRMSDQALKMGAATLSRMAEVLHTGLIDMRGTTSPRLVLELMTARMLLPAASLADGALLQRLERLERRSAIAGEDPGPGTGQGVGAVAAVAAGSAAVSDRRPELGRRSAAAPGGAVTAVSGPPGGAPASGATASPRSPVGGGAGAESVRSSPSRAAGSAGEDAAASRASGAREAPVSGDSAAARTGGSDPTAPEQSAATSRSADGPDLGLPPPPRARPPRASAPAAARRPLPDNAGPDLGLPPPPRSRSSRRDAASSAALDRESAGEASGDADPSGSAHSTAASASTSVGAADRPAAQPTDASRPADAARSTDAERESEHVGRTPPPTRAGSGPSSAAGGTSLRPSGTSLRPSGTSPWRLPPGPRRPRPVCRRSPTCGGSGPTCWPLCSVAGAPLRSC